MTNEQMPDLKTVIAFLQGEGELDGVNFGDTHPTERGAFWWRKHLSAAIAAASAVIVPLGYIDRKDIARLSNYQATIWPGTSEIDAVAVYLATPQPAITQPVQPKRKLHEASRDAAVDTLAYLEYTYYGAALWQPPLGKPAIAEPVEQWQKRLQEGSWENANEGDAKWWASNSPGWECRALYTTPPSPSMGGEVTDKQIDDLAELHATGTDELERYIVTTADLREIIRAATPTKPSEGKL